MSLQNYDGPANSHEVFQHLVGEQIAAAFTDENGAIWLVFKDSGRAFCFGSIGGGHPAFWVEHPEEVRRVVERRERQIKRHLAELRSMPGVKLP